MKQFFIHNILFRLLAAPVYGVLIYLLILLINNNTQQLNETFLGREVYICIGLSYLIFESLRALILLLEKVSPLESNTPTRILIQVLSGILVVMLVTTAAITAYFLHVEGFSVSRTQLITFNAIFIVTSILYNLLYFSNFYLFREHSVKLEKEKVLREGIISELRDFKNEINPALLYDSLETLISVVHLDTDQAEEYIDNLSAVYRYILSHKQVELVPISEELKAANHLLYVLNYKHNDLVHLNTNIDEQKEEIHMVPGTLPTVIEGIIRTSIISRFQPLVINCYTEPDGYLVIQTKLNERLGINKDNQSPLENLQKSYAYFSEKPVVRVKAYKDSYIKIPILEVSQEEVLVNEEI
ncbi:MAG: histidine kinase [Bacteroidota bacterium]